MFSVRLRMVSASFTKALVDELAAEAMRGCSGEWLNSLWTASDVIAHGFLSLTKLAKLWKFHVSLFTYKLHIRNHLFEKCAWSARFFLPASGYSDLSAFRLHSRGDHLRARACMCMCAKLEWKDSHLAAMTWEKRNFETLSRIAEAQTRPARDPASTR